MATYDYSLPYLMGAVLLLASTAVWYTLLHPEERRMRQRSSASISA